MITLKPVTDFKQTRRREITLSRPINPRVESTHFLHQAIVTGEIGIVSRYLASGGTPNVLDDFDCEPIYTAVKYDRPDIAEMLLAAGGNIFRRSKFRGNAFGAACWNWNARMIDFCLAAGVDINELHQGETVLDSIERQRRHVHKKDLMKCRTTYEKLVSLGARHSREL